ncbi:MAG: aminopeptidase P family protein [Alphaproteobacteria bacterium]|nr:aminopeptidase P family protein [Alphaproteobacteria bacterium]
MTRSSSLKTLRELLQADGLYGLLIPHSDQHAHEFLPEHSKLLTHITGFDGSAGLCLVLQDKAVLFVDGRYTLQAQHQVDDALFDLRPYSWSSIEAWIKEAAVPQGARIGFDPWCVSVGEYPRYDALFQQNRATFIPLAQVDAFWTSLWPHRPAALFTPVSAHPDTFTGKSVDAKLADLYAYLTAQNLDTALLSVGESLCWLFNIRARDVPYSPLVTGYALIHKNGTADLFVAKDLVAPDLKERLTSLKITLHSYKDFNPHLERHIQNGQKVLLDKGTAPYASQLLLEKKGALITLGEDPCTRPRALKTSAELEGAKTAHLYDGLALTRFLCWLDEQMREGRPVTELSASKELLTERQKHPAFKEPSFETIAGTGPNGAIVHYRVTPETDRALQKGDLFLVDSGGQYFEGTTDVTRTVFLGDTPTDLQKEHFTRVLKGHIALAGARFPKGTSGHQLDALARFSLWQKGLDYAHGTGHGVGAYLGVHEGPQSISSAPRAVPLEAGMIVSNEPGYYLEGAYGIRIESLQFVKASTQHPGFLDFEMLTLAPLDLRLVEKSLLTHDEKEWVAAYHQRVRDALSPHLDARTAQWLSRVSSAF